ncbi:MFS transporter [Massilia sp. CF038]|uniref:MFS transporter n=1 Tax=Massilia sp. CF038 TaxID=1881045 RepID=UPI00091D26C1|nr:MFS transporter [Massilia sp. CF038]SHH46907.1 MFS transporter, PAT family, beta-lactamase induction signal transducer AmpG [Massilia sp. CF038]
MQKSFANNPWSWIPSLYFVQAIPYVVVMSLSVIIYKDFGISNTDIAFYTSWLYLPWVIKPLWSPFIDMFRTKRWWTVSMQFVVGAALASVALTTHLPAFFQISLAILWLMAFSSATHDIAADGLYMLALPQDKQAAFVGVRSTFYRLANIAGQGLLVYLAGQITERTGDVGYAWSVVLYILAGMFLALCVYHLTVLPRPASDQPVVQTDNYFKEFFTTFVLFFKRKDILLVLGFILTFRLGESQLIKLVVPFLKDPVAKGGLGLSTSDVGWVYGTVGVLFLTLGGLLGGYLISKIGLKRALWLMVFAVHTPDLAFVYLATALPQDLLTISVCIALEQFGYGFGFAALLMYMIMVADGAHKTAHYAICTGLMAAGMMLPGFYSGQIQEWLGYPHFFMYVCLMTLPAFLMAALVKIDPEFGKAPAK